jgi:hypothetical protein
MATVLGFLATIVIGAFGIWFAWYAKKLEQEKQNDLIVKTNPPAPDDIADIDAIQRVQDDRNLPSGK